MTSEAEKRLKRCCFTGHRPEKLGHSELTVKEALAKEIEHALSEGFRTFITGMAWGVDIWAAELVLSYRRTDPTIHLICAIPHPEFEKRMNEAWRERYRLICHSADLIRIISPCYSVGCYQKRNEWMVDHSALVIAVYNGSPGGTRNTIEYAKKESVTVWNAATLYSVSKLNS